jgi:hypothetical protein
MERRRHCEDDVEVGNGEKIARLPFDPESLIETLALRTVSIATGVVGRVLVVAVLAVLEVAAEGRRAARGEIGDDSSLVPRQSARRIGPEDLGNAGAFHDDEQ